ncbi:MAG: DALR anticodon-binding domain-containing protein [Burkholderiales bacterium]
MLKAEKVQIQQSRLALANCTAEIIKTGLDLLGIQVAKRM